MNAEDAVKILREVNVALGAVAFFWLLFKVNKHWAKYEMAFKAYTMSLLLYAFAVAYASAEAIAVNSPPGLRSAFVLAANLSLLFALWKMRGAHTVFASGRSRGRRVR